MQSNHLGKQTEKGTNKNTERNIKADALAAGRRKQTVKFGAEPLGTRRAGSWRTDTDCETWSRTERYQVG